MAEAKAVRRVDVAEQIVGPQGQVVLKITRDQQQRHTFIEQPLEEPDDRPPPVHRPYKTTNIRSFYRNNPHASAYPC